MHKKNSLRLLVSTCLLLFVACGGNDLPNIPHAVKKECGLNNYFYFPENNTEINLKINEIVEICTTKNNDFPEQEIEFFPESGSQHLISYGKRTDDFLSIKIQAIAEGKTKGRLIFNNEPRTYNFTITK